MWHRGLRVLLTVCVILGGCATPFSRNERLSPRVEARFNELSQQVLNQEKVIEELTLQLEKSQRVRAPAIEKKRIVTKLLPPKVSQPSSRLQAESTEVVADSSHESLLFYAEGMRHFENRNYDKAIQSFERFLKMDPEHVYSDRAQYWMIKIHLANGENTVALQQMNRFLIEYPFSFRATDILFDRGMVYMDIGNIPSAKKSFEEIIIRFPKAPAARWALKKLQGLKGSSRI